MGERRLGCPACGGPLTNVWSATVYQTVNAIEEDLALDLEPYDSESVEPTGERDELMCLECDPPRPVAQVADEDALRGLRAAEPDHDKGRA